MVKKVNTARMNKGYMIKGVKSILFVFVFTLLKSDLLLCSLVLSNLMPLLLLSPMPPLLNLSLIFFLWCYEITHLLFQVSETGERILKNPPFSGFSLSGETCNQGSLFV